tara:strand:- start:1824 stop:1925 length:102 start_codon:yes stop_codon:yes gene_type:complete
VCPHNHSQPFVWFSVVDEHEILLSAAVVVVVVV